MPHPGRYVSSRIWDIHIFPVCTPFRAPAGGYARVALRISQFQVTVRQMEAVERVEVRYPFLVPPAGGHFHRQRNLYIISDRPIPAPQWDSVR